jgi:hypothetical protein
MPKLTDLKVSLAKRILESEDAGRLQVIDDLLQAKGGVQLSKEERADLDSDFADFQGGKGRNHTWAEVKAYARRQASLRVACGYVQHDQLR